MYLFPLLSCEPGKESLVPEQSSLSNCLACGPVVVWQTRQTNRPRHKAANHAIHPFGLYKLVAVPFSVTNFKQGRKGDVQCLHSDSSLKSSKSN